MTDEIKELRERIIAGLKHKPFLMEDQSTGEMVFVPALDLQPLVSLYNSLLSGRYRNSDIERRGAGF
jgi:hypothetical protein